MAKSLIFASLCLGLAAPTFAAAPRRPKTRAGVAAPPASVWPMPQTFNLGSTGVVLDASFLFTCATAICPDPLPSAFARYDSYMFFAGTPAVNSSQAPRITGLSLTVGSDAPLTLGVSENYTLTVPAAGGVATATCATAWGCLRALETFSQLFVWQGNQVPTVYSFASAPADIVDFPRWPWRGVLIDSSRHFLTTDAVKTTLDAMSYNKLNTLHWHLVDDNSWPLVSTTLPLMSRGAYAPEATYSHADLADIVSYAFERGIRVMPEFDMPAHASAWADGYPQFVIACADGQTLLSPLPSSGIYDAIDALLGEFLPIFKTDFVHFGGDEVEDLTCWNESAAVQDFIKQQSLGDVNGMRNYFEDRIQTIAQGHGAASQFWEEVFDKNYTLLPSSVVDIWLSYDEVEAAVKSGHRIVSSFGLYLDQQNPYGASHYFWADSWSNFYLNDPTWNRNLTSDEEALILGESLSQASTTQINPHLHARAPAANH
jgi:hexosaminidase